MNIHTKKTSCIKDQPSKIPGEKGGEIKSGGHEMAAVMLIFLCGFHFFLYFLSLYTQSQP